MYYLNCNMTEVVIVQNSFILVSKNKDYWTSDSTAVNEERVAFSLLFWLCKLSVLVLYQ